MASSRKKLKKGSKILVHGVNYKAPNFKLIPAIAQALDPAGA